MITVACVLRSGGCYDAVDVAHLCETDSRFVCLTDMSVPCRAVPLRHDWPGWWAKIELFNPDLIRGDILYFDLDTMFTGPIDDFMTMREPTILRDFYRLNGLQSSMMFIPHAAKREIWEAFTTDPIGNMSRHKVDGDQGFLEEHWIDKAIRWQDVFPGKIVSYKVHGKTPDARVVIFHGRPKPRDIGWRL